MPGSPTVVGAAYGLDAKTGRATVTARTMYVALLTAAPTSETTLATMAEVTTAGYARQTAAFTAPSGTPRVTSNVGALTWGPFSADPPNVTHLALVSAASGTVGDLVAYWTANTARDAAVGDSISANAGAITLQES